MESIQTRKSSRTTKNINQAEIEEVAITLIKTGYKGFLAREREHNDALQNCDAEFLVEGRRIVGRTGDNKGHAEMDAIHIFIDHFLETKFVTTGDNVESLKLLVETWYIRYAGHVFISCTEKNCCFRCSVILGLMGIKPFNEHTTKGNITMGKTQWSASPEVKKFLAAYLAYQNKGSNLSYEMVVDKFFELLSSDAGTLKTLGVVK